MNVCFVSMVMDHYHDKWKDKLPQFPSAPYSPWPVPMPIPTITPDEIAEFKKLLDRAREYDKKMGQPDCELDEKRQALKKVAKELGVEIEFV